MKRIFLVIMLLVGVFAFGQQTYTDFGSYLDSSVVIWESKAKLYETGIKVDKDNKTFVQFRNELSIIHHQLKLSEKRFNYISKNSAPQEELQKEYNTYNTWMDKLRDFQKRYNDWLKTLE